ncbi:hypothetical protein CLU79DRAFT_731889 [Phycomyces nitens]|nr:hypothetical protein CLU79DRAFT_731889 [Phycomyces nitens]
MSVHKLLFLSVFILLILPGCYAPPIDDEESAAYQQGPHINISKTYKILKTIILGYLTHIMTIRPRSDTDQANMAFRRIVYFIYPTLGISTAVMAIISVSKNDTILRIDDLKKTYEEINKPIPIWSKAFAKSLWKTITEIWSQATISIKKVLKPDIETPSEKPEKSFVDAVADMENKYYKHLNKTKPDGKYIIREKNSNSVYLAAILNTLEPSQAKKVKDCILNGSLYLGFDLKDSTLKDDESTDSTIKDDESKASTIKVDESKASTIKVDGSKDSTIKVDGSTDSTMKDDISLIKDKLLYTKNMTITGPGAICQYQVPIRADNVCFLTREMLNQLQPVHFLDNTSYIAICITSGQLVYTVIECIDADGDKWAKVIMLIYTIMSVLQTISLIVLHKQLAAYSIHYDKDIKLGVNLTPDNNDSEIIDILPEYEKTIEKKHDDNVLCYRGSFLEKLSNNEQFSSMDPIKFFKQKKWAFILSAFGGVVVSLLIGIWADYTARSTTQWIVLAWILSPFLLASVYLVRSSMESTNRWLYIPLVFILYFIGIGGAGCVLAATIEGYIITN